MNGTYYQNPTFPTNQNNYDVNMNNPGNIASNTSSGAPGNFNQPNYSSGTTLPMEQSYIENILRLNKGKRVNAYVSYPDSSEWQNKIYSGTIEEAGKDHLIIKDPTTGNWYLIRLIYLNYVEFMEPIIYSHLYSEKTY